MHSFTDWLTYKTIDIYSDFIAKTTY